MTRLGIDFGTSYTVAVLRAPDGTARPLLFDGSPQLPSAVFADPAGGLLTGRDAVHHARTHPERFAPHPKQHVDDDTILLGDAEPRTAAVVGAVLSRVRAEAGPVTEVVLTHPAAWGPRRRDVLLAAAREAGLPVPTLVAEPVAAAWHIAATSGHIVVYDFGAGTFDASVVRATADGFAVLASVGLPDAGGLDVDAAIVAHLLAAHPGWDPAVRGRLEQPVTAADRRARRQLWEDVRGAKEMLSRAAGTFIHVPLLDVDVPLGREQLDQLARPIVDRTVAATKAAVRDAGVPVSQLSGVYLVGGGSRLPLAATVLHRTLGVPPTVLDQPELAVAEGAARGPASPAPPFLPQEGAPLVAHAPGGAPSWGAGAGAGGGGAPGAARRRRGVLVAALSVVLLAAIAIGGYATWSRRDAAHTAGPGPSGSPAPAPGSGTAVAATFPASATGAWTGRLSQNDNRSWRVDVTLAPGTGRSTVTYPELGCEGTLTLVDQAGGAMQVREHITAGPCSPAGTITLTRSGTDEFLFVYVPDDRKYTATGTLTRK